MKREHLFITTEHFENCHKFQIFGVRKDSINQFGLLNKGDIVYFLNKKDELVIGPYEIFAEIFYNEEVIWKRKDGKDEYPYRVRLKSDILYAFDINVFSQVVEESNIRIDSGDLGQKSVFTFLPKDYRKLEEALSKKGREYRFDIKEKKFRENKITIEFAKKEGFNHSFLEFFVLKRFSELFKNENLMLYNQFRINLLGEKIDIIALNEEKILILELKKDKIKNKDIEQTRRYLSWAKDKNNKKLLGEFFKKNLINTKVEAFMIALGIEKNLSLPKDISIKKYSLDPKNDKIELLDL